MYTNTITHHLKVCSWYMSALNNSILVDSMISSGLCGNCVISSVFRSGYSLEKYSESIPLPVAIVNDNMVILYAIEAVLKFVNLTKYDIYGKLFGEIFQCNYVISHG